MCSTASTTTIASSTTIPIASTSANSEIVLAEKPSASIAAKVPTSATGTAMIGTKVARRLPRNTKTTTATSTKASTRVETTLWIEADDKDRRVVGDFPSHVVGEALGHLLHRPAHVAAAVATALAPGAR